MKNNKGFTLAELMAVIVIISILLGAATTAVVYQMSSSTKKADKIGDKNAYVYYVYHGDGDCWFYAAVSEDHKLYRYYYDAVRIGHVPVIEKPALMIAVSIVSHPVDAVC